MGVALLTTTFLAACGQSGYTVANQVLQQAVTGTAASAVKACLALKEELLSPNFRDFNVQELLWHVVLLREQFAAAGILVIG